MSFADCIALKYIQAKFAGDNFFRYSGEAPDVQDLQLFAWQAAARGNDVHLNANPTQGELLHYEFKQKKEQLKDTTKSSILAKYGGAEYLDSAPKELRQGQTENYVEYSRTGQVIKGREKAKARSKYPEDGNFISYPHFVRALNSILQCMSIITPASGDHGTTPLRDHGDMHVVTQFCMLHIVPGWLELRQQMPATLKAC